VGGTSCVYPESGFVYGYGVMLGSEGGRRGRMSSASGSIRRAES